jgi:uncharacterized protein (UPF0333 family)
MRMQIIWIIKEVERMKGQGSLEYLIIIAAVLAIAAVVVMFLTGAFGGQKAAAGVAQCQAAASDCYKNLQLYSATYDCTATCDKACTDAASGTSLVADINACYTGNPTGVTAPVG